MHKLTLIPTIAIAAVFATAAPSIAKTHNPTQVRAGGAIPAKTH